MKNIKSGNGYMEDNLFTLKEIGVKSGQTLMLRRPTEDDAEKMIEYLNIVGGESDNLLFGENEFNLSIEEEREYINNSNNKSNLMIIGIIDNDIVCIGQIRKLTRKRIAHNSEIAISVKKDYWGIGIGSSIMEELIGFAKTNDIKIISLGVREKNNKAINLYKKYGFKEVGVHKNYFNINGVFYDEILMDLYIE